MPLSIKICKLCGKEFSTEELSISEQLSMIVFGVPYCKKCLHHYRESQANRPSVEEANKVINAIVKSTK